MLKGQKTYRKNKPAAGINQVHLFILSRKPFTVEGLKSYLEKHASLRNNLIVSSCPDSCCESLKEIPCGKCNLASDLREEKNHGKNFLMLVDDFGFADSFYNSNNEELFGMLRNFSALGINKIILLTGSNNPLYLNSLVKLGIRGLVHTTSSKENMLTAIEAVNIGAVYIDARINQVISDFQKYLGGHPVKHITYRQLQILSLISAGLKNQKIAEKLFITAGSIEKQKNNMELLLNLNSADELYSFAVNNRNEIQFLLEFSEKAKN